MIICKDKSCKREFKTEHGMISHWGIMHGPNKTPKTKWLSGKDHWHTGKPAWNKGIKTSYVDRVAKKSCLEDCHKTIIRGYLLETRGCQCEECGFDKNILRKNGSCILEVHHIDGNSKNDKENNLQIVCPNCHALTENFRYNNKSSRSSV